jgi:outer membrane lipoprotein carrier protein
MPIRVVVLVFSLIAVRGAFAAAGAASPASAVGTASCPDPTTIVRKLQERYDETRAFRAHFRQETRVESLGVSDVSEGTVVFKKPGKMRWDYQTPKPQEIVSDGTTLWIHQPEDRQVLKAPFRGGFVSTTPVSFLLGVGRITDQFRPQVDARGCSATRLYVGLAAKSTDELGALAFGLDRATFDIVEAAVTDPIGNVTTLTFSEVARNVDVPDTTFDFQIPPGVDIITPPGGAPPPPS